MAAFIPYPAIEQHGVIGDQRTAALVSSDGTVDWLCLPDYDGHVVFGALLDTSRGGHWRVGPSTLWAGEQDYPSAAPILRTRWVTSEYALELTDLMAPPREGENRERERVLLRRLECLRGRVECISAFSPSFDFHPVDPQPCGSLAADLPYVCWCSDPSWSLLKGTRQFTSGTVIWMAFSAGRSRGWRLDEAEGLFEDAQRFWNDAVNAFRPALHGRLVRSAVTIRLLEYAPAGSIVASPTTSLPERIGGSWNADYRLTWVRDASLSVEALVKLGDLGSARRYFEWVTARDSTTTAPLQVTYDIRGGTRPRQRDRRDLEGWRGSKPVRFGNHAYRQQQHDEFGYLADCVLVYVDSGGECDARLWDLLVRVANYVARHWREPGNGVWELEGRLHYTSSSVMSWVTLDRVLRIAERTHRTLPEAGEWRRVKDEIFADVTTHAWSESLGAFVQSTENEVLDASTLLIPVMGFLPPTDPRVISTITRIAARLTIDGCVYRFDPQRVPKLGPSALGQFEGAFLPCTFWLATAFALIGRTRDAENILHAVEAVAGRLGLFAEGLDPRNRMFLGNTPLLFSHVEYVRAVQTINRTG
jgi:GH15 family glucan-1,4-alpha-glucosidase